MEFNRTHSFAHRKKDHTFLIYALPGQLFCRACKRSQLKALVLSSNGGFKESAQFSGTRTLRCTEENRTSISQPLICLLNHPTRDNWQWPSKCHRQADKVHHLMEHGPGGPALLWAIRLGTLHPLPHEFGQYFSQAKTDMDHT